MRQYVDPVLKVSGLVSVRRNLSFDPSLIKVFWSDDLPNAADSAGIMLAHALAGHALRDLRRGLRKMEDALAANHLGKRTFDATDLVSGNLSGAVVDRWERETGLKAPD